MVILKYKLYWVVGVLTILSLLGLTTRTTFAQSVSSHPITSLSLGSLHVLHPANSGGGCQYSSEEIIEVCISEDGSTIVGDAYINVRVTNCWMDFELINNPGLFQHVFYSAHNCSNMTGWVGNDTHPAGSAGNYYVLYAALYVNNSFWVDGWSPTLELCC